MIMRKSITVCFLILASMHTFAQPLPKRIDVFTFEQFAPVNLQGFDKKGSTVNVYFIDQFNNFKKGIDARLPKDPREAQRIAERIVQDNRSEIEQQVAESVQTKWLISQYKIKQFPAIVIDRRYMIEGTSNIAEAVTIWQSKWN